jgi:hypothetical protein
LIGETLQRVEYPELGMLTFHGKDSVDQNQGRFDMMANPASSKRERQPKARKFYEMDQDLRVRGAPGYKLENRGVLLQGQLALDPPVGRRGSRAAAVSVR